MGVARSAACRWPPRPAEGTSPTPAPEPGRMGSWWPAPRPETRVNFARHNPVLCWWLGGLNFQIEHHLFPRVCHVHYPALSRIVEATCQEYGVRYRAHPTFWAGLVSHYRWLRALGQPASA